MSPEAKAEVRLGSEIQDDPTEDEGRCIQRALLPPAALSTTTFDVSYRLYSYAQVGGDFLDYFLLPNGCLGIYLGDVVGKGLAAAMYAALAMGTMRGIHKNDLCPRDVMTLFNRRLRVRAVPRRYCAAQYALFNPITFELRLSNAGLPLPLRLSAAGCSTVGEGGLPPGLFDDVQYEENGVRLAPGDAVLFATDGVHEMVDPRGEPYGSRRIMEFCRKCDWKSSEELLESVFDDLSNFTAGQPHLDDVTAVALQVVAR